MDNNGSGMDEKKGAKGRKESSRVLKSEKDGWACGDRKKERKEVGGADRKKGERKMRKKRTAWSKTRGK